MLKKNSLNFLLFAFFVFVVSGSLEAQSKEVNGLFYSDNLIGKNNFNIADTKELFSQVIKEISTKYIKEISAKEVSNALLSGLSSIDENITISYGKKRAIVYYKGDLYKTYPIVDDENDYLNWARITTGTILVIREKSKKVRKIKEIKLYDILIKSAVSHLDKNSVYIEFDEVLEEETLRKKEGFVGLIYEPVGDALVIKNVKENSSADKAFLRKGDKITHINNKPVADSDIQEIIEKIRGEENTKLEITVEKKVSKKTQKIKLNRASKSKASTDVFTKNDIVFAQIFSFLDTTPQELKEKIQNEIDFLEEDFKGLIIDLRGNKGGVLERAIEIADFFLDEGIIIYEKGRHINSTQAYKSTKGDIANGKPIVVITDKNTASSAEVLAISLQENYRSIIVGTPTYGKNTIQTVIELINGGHLILTWAKYYSPNNNPIRKNGVLPNICMATSLTPVLPIFYEFSTEKREKKLSKSWEIKANEFSLWNKSENLSELEGKICPRFIIKEPERVYQKAVEILQDKQSYVKAINNLMKN